MNNVGVQIPMAINDAISSLKFPQFQNAFMARSGHWEDGTFRQRDRKRIPKVCETKNSEIFRKVSVFKTVLIMKP